MFFLTLFICLFRFFFLPLQTMKINNKTAMKFYKEYWGTAFEFDGIKQFVLFTFGRICGFLLFFLLLEGFFYYIHTQGYTDEPFPISSIIFNVIKLFI